MKLTLNKFLIIFFLLTSVFPILGLGFLHINYLHQILNENKSFLTLIEHEEFNLFLIYSGIVITGMISGLIIFRNLVLEPFNSIASKLNILSQGENILGIQNSKKYLHEIQIFINEFNKAIDTMQIAKQQRNDFIATLTHDLRVPLIAEQKAFKLLMDYALDTDNRSKLMNSLIHSNEDLLKLVNNLLDSYKFEEGQMIINKTRVSVSDLIERSLLSLYPLLTENEIRIIKDFQTPSSTDSKIYLDLDESQFIRVLNNILLNAIQNSPKASEITIQSRLVQDALEISIIDEGYGMDENKINTIFDRYSSENKLGTGLGLYVSKLIIEAHSAQIFAKNKSPKGVEFVISLPTKTMEIKQ
jgi:signal transduction histidine kinase